jgi:hypothetical protein
MTSCCLQLNTILIAAANQIACQMCQFQCSFHIEKLGHFTHVDLQVDDLSYPLLFCAAPSVMFCG